jgi:DNA-binding NtrC family response regulator
MASGNRETGRSKYQIMIVDDDASVRAMLVRVMLAEGYAAWPAANRAEALEIVASVTLDLVVLDLGLPGADGWDVFEHLILKHPLLAVIVITAAPGQAAVAEAAAVGAFFEKPLDFAALLGSVRRLLAEPPEFRLARLHGRSAPRPFVRTMRGIGQEENL